MIPGSKEQFIQQDWMEDNLIETKEERLFQKVINLQKIIRSQERELELLRQELAKEKKEHSELRQVKGDADKWRECHKQAVKQANYYQKAYRDVSIILNRKKYESSF